MSAHSEPVAGRGATTLDRVRVPGRYPTYRPHHRWAWWQRNRNYQIYMVREASAFFAAIWAWNQLRQIKKLNQGEQSYQDYVRSQRSPGSVFLNAVGAGFLTLHTVTWLKLFGGLDLLKFGDRKVSQEQATSAAFVGWGAVSGILGLILLFGGRRR